MAIKIAIVGNPNTGKSYSRKFIEKGEEVFIVAPSHKLLHITDSKGKKLKPLERDREGNYLSGNYIINPKISNLGQILDFVSKIDKIKVIILPDFTHYVSNILADPIFIRRKAGGEAFQRFWELASDILQNFIIKIDKLRKDLILIVEYHMEYDEISENWKIFIPGGKMVEEKFKLESYYDIILFTHIEMNENKTVKSYNFVVNRWDKYPARSAGLFPKDTILIENNLNLILNKLTNN